MVIPALPSSGLRVQLVAKPASPATGIGRYVAETERGLRMAGVEVRRAELWVPIPGAVGRVARRAGYDLETFARSYPVRADARSGFITHLTSQTLALLLRTQRLPRPTVVTVHDILPYVLRDDPELTVYRHRVERAIDGYSLRNLRNADRIVAISHYTKQTLVDYLGMPAERIDVVHNGVDPKIFCPRPVPDEFRRGLGLEAGQRMVLHVGSEDPRKGMPLLLRALAIAKRDVPGIALVKVGAPSFAEQRARNRALCRELGIDNDVKWVGAVPEEELPLFYSAADIFAFPSLFEGFGLPVLEALACGTPVVAFRRSSVPELVGDVCPLVEPATPEAMAAALVRLLSRDNADPADLVARARQFGWDTAARALVSTYRRAGA